MSNVPLKFVGRQIEAMASTGSGCVETAFCARRFFKMLAYTLYDDKLIISREHRDEEIDE